MAAQACDVPIECIGRAAGGLVAVAGVLRLASGLLHGHRGITPNVSFSITMSRTGSSKVILSVHSPGISSSSIP